MLPPVPAGAVVVGVDDSPSSNLALAWALRRVGERATPVVLVHAAGSLGVDQVPFRAEGGHALLAAGQRVADLARAVAARLAPDVPVTAGTVLGDPVDVLVDASEQAAQVVLGSRGRGPARSRLLGSVGLSVAGRAHCPVTVVRPRLGPELTAERHVVVGVDVAAPSQPALDFAFDLASRTSRLVDVVNAWRSHDTFSPARPHGVDALEHRERLLGEALARYAVAYPDVVIDWQLSERGAVETLVDRSRSAGHVVVGSRERTGVRALLGSVGRAVVERAHCPVTVARPSARVHAFGPTEKEMNRS